MQQGRGARARATLGTDTRMRRRNVSALAFALLGTATGWGAHVALAQAPATNANRDAETIVVTAQGRSEDLEDVAMAVDAFDGDALIAAGVTDAMQLQTVVPSLTDAGHHC